jgi:2-methylisocitrate lyase-like PEP mutase family enzyme
MTAKLAEQAGFEVHYLTGYGTAAAMTGLPDVGLLTMSEMVDGCRRICDSVSGPVIADADTGYGNPLNVMRTVREYERAGAAGIQLEDQTSPKRCGLIGGKSVISSRAMTNKLYAALDARRSDSFVVIARTDAIEPEGIDGAIRRAIAYRKAGADAILVDAPETFEQIERIAREVPGPLVFDWSLGGQGPHVSRQTLVALGFQLILFADATAVIHRTMSDFLRRLKRTDSLEDLDGDLTPFEEFNTFIGLPQWTDVGKRYAD